MKLFLTVLLLALPGTQERANELSGLVRDESGAPVENAEVRVHAARRFQPLTTKTEASGRFRLTLTPGDREPLYVTIFAEGFVGWSKREVALGEALDVTLSSGRSVEGVVTDARTGEPVADARVEGIPTRLQFRLPPEQNVVRTMTDNQGRFRLDALPESHLTVAASAAGYGRVEVGVAEDETRTILSLLPGAGIRGVVVGPDGAPVEGARIGVVSESAGMWWRPSPYRDESDASGAFALFGVEPGRYHVVVHHDALAFRVVPDVLVESADVVLDEIQLERGGAIVGRLVDVDGEPVEGSASLTGIDGERTAVSALAIRPETSEEGRFRVEKLPAGEYTLSFDAPGYVGDSVTAYLEPSDEPLDLGDIVLGDGLAISGFVVDESGVPIPDALVHVSSSSYLVEMTRGSVNRGSAETDAEGRFRIAGLEAEGSYRLSASAPDFTMDPSGEIVESGAADIVLALERSGTIRARVVDVEGRPVERADVSVTPVSRRQAGMRHLDQDAENGELVLRGLSEGTYTVTLSADGMKPEPITRAEVESGKTTDLGTVVLTTGGTIRGWVLDPDDNPLPGASVVAGNRAMLFANPVKTDVAGYFELGGLEDGVVDVRVSHPDYADAVAEDVELRSADGPATIRVRMAGGGRIEGTVRTRDGAGVPGRIVRLVGDGRGPETSATTDADGGFRLEHVSTGRKRVQLLASDPSYAATVQELEVDVVESQTAFVEFVSSRIVVSGHVSKGGVSLGGVHLQLRPEDSRGGFGMFGGAAGRPVSGPLALNAITTRDGYYELYVDAPGRYEARVSSPDMSTRYPAVSVDIPDVASHVADIVLATVTLSGQVVSEETQEPVHGASVRLAPINPGPIASTVGFSETDASGAFHIEAEPGRYRMVVRAEGYSPLERAVAVSDSTGSNLLLELAFGRVLRGTVADANGNPPGHFYVHAVEDVQPTTDPPRFSDWAVVHPDGTFEIRDLAPLRYNVLAGSDLDGFAFAPGVEPGTELTFRLRPAAWIHVRVVDAAGAPVRGARVAVSALGGRKIRVANRSTDSKGMAELYAPAGSLELKAVGEDDSQGIVAVSAHEGERLPVEIVLRLAPAR